MRMPYPILEKWLEGSFIRPIDYAFARFVADEFQPVSDELICIAAFLSSQSGSQHVCVPVYDIQNLLLDTFGHKYDVPALIESSVAVVSIAKDVNDKECVKNHPIVFQNNALYLQRYWTYETSLLLRLSQLANMRASGDASENKQDKIADIKELLLILFPEDDSAEGGIDWQKVAVAVAALNPVTFITGGPGTGKTTTVVKLMALLQGVRKRRGQSPLMIKLAAPTGKAAARLSESIEQAKGRIPENLADELNIRCTTIHRLMGTRYQSIHYTHNQQNPIHADLIVVDEASMIDLPMMSKFFHAVADDCQVVLLGDSEQLASVEVGSVLNDICMLAEGAEPYLDQAEKLAEVSGYSLEALKQSQKREKTIDGSGKVERYSRLASGITRLYKSHRFNDRSDIGQLAKAIRLKDVNKALGLLSGPDAETVKWYPSSSLRALVDAGLPNLIDYCQAVELGDIKKAFSLLKKQQILCSHRRGSWGVEKLNQLFELELAKRSLITPDSKFYQCRPIMVTQNSHEQNLFNGDIGIIAFDHNGETTKAWFETGDGELKSVLTNRLPEHETVYAMTVHKSQGSEFEQVLLCLPYEQSRKMHLTKSMLYTGLTRAKRQFTLFGSSDMVKASILTEVKRGSGLSDRLLMLD